MAVLDGGGKRQRTSTADDGSIDASLAHIFTKLGRIEARCDDNGRSLAHLVTLKGRVDSVEAIQEAQCTEITAMKAQIQKLQIMCSEMSCKLLEKDVIIFNVEEQPNEDIYCALCDFLYFKLLINDPHRLTIDKVWRRGKPRPGKNRPIIVSFTSMHDCVMVKGHSKNLRGTKYSVREHYPEDIEMVRRELYPIEKEARRAGRKTRLVGDKLFIDGQLYVKSHNSLSQHHTGETERVGNEPNDPPQSTKDCNNNEPQPMDTLSLEVHKPTDYTTVTDPAGVDEDNRNTDEPRPVFQPEFPPSCTPAMDETLTPDCPQADGGTTSGESSEPKATSPMASAKAKICALINRHNQVTTKNAGQKANKSHATKRAKPAISSRSMVQTSLFPETVTLNSPLPESPTTTVSLNNDPE